MSMDTAYIGDDVDIDFEALDHDGRPVDLTGAVLFCDVVRIPAGTPVPASGFAIDDGPRGLARARFDSTQTATWDAGATYAYDGRVRLSSGLIRTIGKGSFKAVAAKTPTP